MREIIKKDTPVPARGHRRATRPSSSSARWARPTRSRSSSAIPEGRGDHASTGTASPGTTSGSTSARARTSRARASSAPSSSPASPARTGAATSATRCSSASTARRSRRKEALDEHLKLLEEAKKRDHRKLGKELDLFMFHEYAPAMPFFLPRGAFVYKRLVDYLRGLYVEYGYEEVLTPQIFDKRLFETSGHLGELPREHVPPRPRTRSTRRVDGESRRHVDEALELALKPMNCPSHCLIFGSRRRSYRELPWRVADFGRLHRYERGGVVHGLTRVRSFCQDDAHIFCAPEQRPGRDSRASSTCFYDVYNALGFDRRRHQARDPAREAHRHRRAVGRGREGARRRADRRRASPSRCSPGEGRVLRPEARVPRQGRASSAAGSSARSRSTTRLPDRFELEYAGDDGNGAPAGHAPPRDPRIARAASSAFTSSTWPASSRCGSRPSRSSLVTVSEKQVDYADEARSLPAGQRACAS